VTFVHSPTKKGVYMKRNWKKEELEQQWTVFAFEQELLKGRTGPTR